jgi:hypothetical protein
MRHANKPGLKKKYAPAFLAAVVMLLLGGTRARAQSSDSDGCSDAMLTGDYFHGHRTNEVRSTFA